MLITAERDGYVGLPVLGPFVFILGFRSGNRDGEVSSIDSQLSLAKRSEIHRLIRMETGLSNSAETWNSV